MHNIYFHHYHYYWWETKRKWKWTESHRIIIRPKKKMEYKSQFVNIENENFSHFSNWFLESFSFHSTTTTTTKKMNLSEYNRIQCVRVCACKTVIQDHQILERKKNDKVWLCDNFDVFIKKKFFHSKTNLILFWWNSIISHFFFQQNVKTNLTFFYFFATWQLSR